MNTTISVEQLLSQAQQLAFEDQLRLLEGIASLLRHSKSSPAPRLTLAETYGILADDPIERPPQLPLQEREPLE